MKETLNNRQRTKCPYVQLRWFRRHYKIVIFIALVLTTVTMLLVSWRYEIEMKRLIDIRAIQMEPVQRMIALSNTKLKLKDRWRQPDVKHASIFSAYLELRPEVILEEVPDASDNYLWALVRIIGIVSVESDNFDISCYYKYPSLADESKVSAEIQEAPAMAVNLINKDENFNMPYSAAFILCSVVMADDGRLPIQVTFSSKRDRAYEQLEEVDFVDIHYTNRTEDYHQNRFMAVCGQTMHHEYSKYLELIEFVEFYRMMGVNHFTFYNTSINQRVNKVLAHYERLGVITVLQWKLDTGYAFERDLRYNGIFAALNDCLYRSTMIGGFRYVVNVDLDEFIVPRLHDNYKELMDSLDPPISTTNEAIFVFHNMFFYLMYEDDKVIPKHKGYPRLLLHTKTRRLQEINYPHSRSKYILRGQDAVELGNHYVAHSRKISLTLGTTYKEKYVDPLVAGSHHYRNCEVNELVCYLRKTMIDRAAHRFTNELGARVATTYRLVFK